VRTFSFLHVYVHILLIDKGFHEAKISDLSCADFINVSTIFPESSLLFTGKSYSFLIPLSLYRHTNRKGNGSIHVVENVQKPSYYSHTCFQV
jgi:hypothetical protein